MDREPPSTMRPACVAPRQWQLSALDRWSNRLTGLLVALGASVPLSVAAWLTPASQGVGTHKQLGLPPCRFLETSGIPCPTCGMTTAFALAADGRFLDAVIAQPMGAAMALALAAILLIGLWGLLAGADVRRLLTPLLRMSVLIALTGLGLIAWLYSIAHYKGLTG